MLFLFVTITVNLPKAMTKKAEVAATREATVGVSCQ